MDRRELCDVRRDRESGLQVLDQRANRLARSFDLDQRGLVSAQHVVLLVDPEVLRELDLSTPAATVDFDLAHLNVNERRIEKLWLDLIIDQPAMNRVVFRDLTFCRYHRADL